MWFRLVCRQVSFSLAPTYIDTDLITPSLWLQGVALTLPSLSSEFGISEKQVRYTTCSLFVGLCIGASFWGVGSDVMGRRLAFNATLFLAGVFGIAAGAAPSWIVSYPF